MQLKIFSSSAGEVFACTLRITLMYSSIIIIAAACLSGGAMMMM
jgi:hypothetical protein